MVMTAKFLWTPIGELVAWLIFRIDGVRQS